MSDTQQDPGWWQANDGKWYPPDLSKLPDPPLPDGQWRTGKGLTREQLVGGVVVGVTMVFVAIRYLDRWFG